MPKLVEALKGNHRIVQVAISEWHTAVLTAEGEVLTFGRGEHGQLGHGDQEVQLLPKVVEALAQQQLEYIKIPLVEMIKLNVLI